MTTKAQLRKAALGLPDVSAELMDRRPVYSVHGKVFAELTDDNQVELKLAPETLAPTLTKFPSATTPAPEAVRIPLADINGMDLNSLVYRAWLSRAPASLVEAAQSAAKGAGNDDSHGLPPGIGKPATRALLLAGIRTLENVADHSEQELLGLHGVGPRAIRLLGEALLERKLTFRG